MYRDGKIILGKATSDEEVYIYPKMANRHGLIAGATGTGKTTTLRNLAESFSEMGVPVFLADAKGDLQGICEKYPTNFWDVYGEKGIQLRTTISEMGPLLLSRIMGLNDTQTDILSIIFKIADDNGLLLIDTKDLKSMLNYVSDNSKEFSAEYGNLPTASINVITRAVVSLEAEGGETFFGEPALNIKDWIKCGEETGKGFIQILECAKLMLSPKMYSMFLLWMISELYETLPEAGDLEKPKMVFFFDEAHMLFDSAPKVLLEKIEQVVKLIRSKGVGIYFITQNPKDIPDGVLSQLGNKIQHALHAYTPSEQKSMKAAADGLRANPEFDTYKVLGELGVGEALVSVLDETGVPTIVEKTKIYMPSTEGGLISDALLDEKIHNASLYDKYSFYVDNESAYERLTKLAAEEMEEKLAEKERIQKEKEDAKLKAQLEKEQAAKEKAELKEKEAKSKAVKKAAKSVVSTTAGSIGRQVGNSLGNSMGGKFGKSIGGNIGASLGRGLIGTFFK